MAIYLLIAFLVKKLWIFLGLNFADFVRKNLGTWNMQMRCWWHHRENAYHSICINNQLTSDKLTKIYGTRKIIMQRHNDNHFLLNSWNVVVTMVIVSSELPLATMVAMGWFYMLNDYLTIENCQNDIFNWIPLQI